MLEKSGNLAERRFGVAFIVGLGTFLSRILGLIREQIFAFYFGASHSMDAFQIAFRFPNLMKDLFAEGALSSALVSPYLKVRERDGEARAWAWLNGLVSFLILIGALASAVVYFFSDKIVQHFAGRFLLVPGKYELTVSLMKIMAPFVPLVILAGVWMGVLNARGKYGVSMLAPSVFNIVSIVAAISVCPLLALNGIDPIFGMAIAATIGGTAQWLLQVPTLSREGFRLRLKLGVLDIKFVGFLIFFILEAVALAATQINVLINASTAASLGPGTVSWLNYAFRFLQFPIGVFGVAISTSNLLQTSQFLAKNEIQKVTDATLDALKMLFFLTIPSTFGLTILAHPIISVIYGHGKFTDVDVTYTGNALAVYASALCAYGVVKVLVPIMYSCGWGRWAILFSALNLLFNYVLSLFLVKKVGYLGLPLSLALAAMVNAGGLLWALCIRFKQFPFLALISHIGKCLVCSLVMSTLLFYSLKTLGISPLSPIPLTSHWVKATFSTHLFFLFALLLVGFFSYLGMGKIFQLPEVEKLRTRLCKQ